MKSDTALLAIVILAFMGVVSSCQGAVDARFLDAVKRVESGGNSQAVGDRGKALGHFQFWRGTWDDCSRIRQSKGLKTYPYSCATNAYVSRLYAGTWLKHLESRLVALTGKKPSKELIYASFNAGIKGVKRRNYDLQKMPTSTKKALSKL